MIIIFFRLYLNIWNISIVLGKTLLLKAKAREVAQDPLKTVYYISLASINLTQVPPTGVHTLPAVFDIATELQFRGTNVSFLSALDLKKLHQTETGTVEENVFSLVTWFVKREPLACYFIDEYAYFSVEADMGELLV